MKHNPGMEETASQPVPAQTADLSISGLRFMSPLCTRNAQCDKRHFRTRKLLRDDRAPAELDL